MKQGLKFGLQMIGYYATLLVLCLLFLGLMGGASFWLQVVLNVLLVAGFSMLLLNSGGYRGERAASLTATLEKRRAEGHLLDPAQQQESFSKKTAGIGYLVAVLPFLLLAVVNVVYYPAFEAKLANLPPLSGVVQSSSNETDNALSQLTDPALVNPENDPGLVRVDVNAPGEMTAYSPDYTNWLAAATRIAFMPYISLTTKLSDNAYLLYLLFIPLSLVLPLFGAIGYLLGPKLRDKKLKEIEAGTKKKKRNLKVNKKPRTPREPKHEV